MYWKVYIKSKKKQIVKLGILIVALTCQLDYKIFSFILKQKLESFSFYLDFIFHFGCVAHAHFYSLFEMFYRKPNVKFIFRNIFYHFFVSFSLDVLCLFFLKHRTYIITTYIYQFESFFFIFILLGKNVSLIWYSSHAK